MTEPQTAFVYDTTGNLITTADPLNYATQQTYDALSASNYVELIALSEN